MIDVQTHAKHNAPRCPLCLADADRGALTVCEVCGAAQHASCVRELGACHPVLAPTAPVLRGRPRRHPLRRYRRRRTDEAQNEQIEEALGAELQPSWLPARELWLPALPWVLAAVASCVLTLLEHPAAFAPLLALAGVWGSGWAGATLLRGWRPGRLTLDPGTPDEHTLTAEEHFGTYHLRVVALWGGLSFCLGLAVLSILVLAQVQL
ncbi:MAG: hypothetical protein R3F62_25635 [Planctomycetota bacterium]